MVQVANLHQRDRPETTNQPASLQQRNVDVTLTQKAQRGRYAHPEPKEAAHF
jgi:hypothetical protein